ncbi:MAG: sugar transferase [Opitutaceae bacterium]|jgi:lipopolysaccharide/colanic/teichoic acid biosynthesis glycosyltransferase
MNPKLPSRLSPDLFGHLASFQSRRGLFTLNVRYVLRRLASKWLVVCADFGRRVLDILGSLAALVVLSPLFLLIGALVRLDGGPAIFAQTRVLRYGREFKMFKFRSMRPDSDKLVAELLAANKHGNGVTFKIKNDPRITTIGRWLRRFSLDELPQFFNVLIGDMSLVGPRPPVPREVALYTLADRRRLAVKPGITCIWQISGRAEIDFPGQVRLDVGYIESQSLAQDIKILAKTPRAVVFGSGAY